MPRVINNDPLEAYKSTGVIRVSESFDVGVGGVRKGSIKENKKQITILFFKNRFQILDFLRSFIHKLLQCHFCTVPMLLLHTDQLFNPIKASGK